MFWKVRSPRLRGQTSGEDPLAVKVEGKESTQEDPELCRTHSSHNRNYPYDK